MWRRGFLKQGGEVKAQDLPDLPTHNDENQQCVDRLYETWSQEQKRANTTAHTSSASFSRALFKAFYPLYFKGLFFFCIHQLLDTTQPLLLTEIIEYFENPTTLSSSRAYLCAGKSSILCTCI